jgi:hypothetical protein
MSKRRKVLIASGIVIVLALYLCWDYSDFRNKKHLAATLPAGAGAICTDGWISPSTGRGTCSHHGGVKYWATEIRGAGEHGWFVYSVVPLLAIGGFIAIPVIFFFMQERRNNRALRKSGPQK